MEKLNEPRCFLCRQKSMKTNKFPIDEKMICPSSGKPITQVLEFIAQLINSSIESLFQIPSDAQICEICYGKIKDYDFKFVSLLKQQHVMERLVEKAILDVETDYEDECYEDMQQLAELNDDHYFDDVGITEDEIFRETQENVSYHLYQTEQGSIIQETRRPYSEGRVPWRTEPHKRELPCDYCGNKFTTKQALDSHIDNAHKKHKCPHCDYAHRNKDYVTLHLNLHEGRAENQCRFCEKVFSSKVSAIRHMESHYDTKNYQCDKCGLCFSQTTSLYNHKLLHESEDNPLSCDICMQKFKTKRTFRHHKNRHLPNRPRFFCNFCSRSFTEKYTLKVHQWRMHSSNVPPADKRRTKIAKIIETSSLDENEIQSVSVEEIIGEEDYIIENVELQPVEQDAIETAIAVDSISAAASLPILYATEDADGTVALQTSSYLKGPNPPVAICTIKLPAATNHQGGGGDQGPLACVICNNAFSNRELLDKHMENEHDVILKPMALISATNEYSV